MQHSQVCVGASAGANMVLSVLVMVILCTGAQDTGCRTEPVVKGETATMTFLLRQQVIMSPGKVYVYVRRNDSIDVVNCQRKEKESHIECTVPDSKHYKSDGIVNGSLTLHIFNVTHNDAGTYEARAYIDDSPEPPVLCQLVVNNKTEDVHVSRGTSSAVVVVVPIMCLIIVANIIFCCIAKRKRIYGKFTWKGPAHAVPSNDEYLDLDETGIPMTTKADESALPDVCGNTGLLDDWMTHSPSNQTQNKRWFFKQLTNKEENMLLNFQRNSDGSFLIRQGVTDNTAYTLAVCFDGVIRHFPIREEGTMFEFCDAGTSFHSLDELVEHYKQHDIKIGLKPCGKLQKPFEIKPDHEWFFEDIATRADEENLLQPKTYGDGSFLIRECISVPDDYTLTVFFNDVLNHLRILPVDCGYRFRDLDMSFPTLADLVEHFKESEIELKGKQYGKLVRPFERQLRNE